MISRFWNKVNKQSTEDCWTWTGAKCSKQYGCLRYNNKTLSAHRVSWELHNGPIPRGLHVLHKCDNPSCVNPNHLWLGTNYDNVQDRQNKGRYNKDRDWFSKLDKYQVLIIKQFIDIGMTNTKIATIFSINHRTVSAIKKNKIWKHI